MSALPILTMKPIQIHLTPQQRDRLLKLLKRATLTGVEVPAYAELFNLICSAKPETETGA